MVKVIETPYGAVYDIAECEQYTAYKINGEIYEEMEATEVLSGMFRDMCRECEIDFGDDEVAESECFNNWTDSLNKCGDICDDTYNDICLE